MACPVLTGGGAFMVVTGMYSVFFQDRRYRRIWWTGLLALALGWFGYYTAFDRADIVRYLLEVLSVGFFLVIGGRLFQLVVRDGHRPPGSVFIAKMSKVTEPYTLNRMTIALKTVIVTMIVFEFFGQAEFSWHWYLGVSLVLVTWIVFLILLYTLGKRIWENSLKHSKLVALFLTTDSAGGCPLGYGKKSK